MQEPQIIKIALSDITVAPANARHHPDEQIKQIADSIQAFEWTVPLLVDKDNTLIAGHGRLSAAQLLGLSEVPVIRLEHLTPEQVRAYRIADNRLAELAGWDEDILGQELEALRELDVDLALTGFDDAALDTLLGSSDGDVGSDDAPEPPEEPTTQPGDVWVMGGHRLICGDSTDKATVERLLEGATPRLMVTDPPFGVNYDPKWRNKLSKAKRRDDYMPAEDDDTVDFSAAWSLAPCEVVYIWQGGNGVVEQYIALETMDWDVRQIVIWLKQSPVITQGPYSNQREFCCYAVKKGCKADWIGPPAISNVWQAAWEGGTQHAAQKPIELMERPISYHKGDVYEPFSGSGTTIIAAERQGRRCWAVELDPAYCDVAVRRWEEATGRKAERG